MVMEEYENCIVKFGKYRGCTYKYVAENHFMYAMHTYHKNKNIEEEFRQYLKEYLFLDTTKDPLLKNAWYQDPRAEVLQRLDLEPNLFEEEDSDEDEEEESDEKELKYFESVTTSEVTKQEYISKLDQELIIEQGVDLILGKSFGNNMYLLLPEVVNSALALHKKFLENRRSDMRYIKLGIPSKVITLYWVTCKTPDIEKTPGYKLLTGKWMLFFDRINENEFGLTDFDIRFQLLRDNITNLNIIFKVSTRRPSPTSSSDRTGVIIVYCREDDRIDVLLRVADTLGLERKKNYNWKSDASTRQKKYLVNGDRASDYSIWLDDLYSKSNA